MEANNLFYLPFFSSSKYTAHEIQISVKNLKQSMTTSNQLFITSQQEQQESQLIIVNENNYHGYESHYQCKQSILLNSEKVLVFSISQNLF